MRSREAARRQAMALREDEIDDSGAYRHAVLVAQTACRVFDRTWHDLTSAHHVPRGGLIIDRAITSVTAHRRTAATNDQIARVLGHHAGKRGYARDARRMIRDALAAGDHLIEQRIALLDAAIDDAEADGIDRIAAPAKLTYGRQGRMTSSNHGGLTVYGGYHR